MRAKRAAPPDAAELRRQAEAKLSKRRKRDAAPPETDAATQRLVNELQVHQIELEMQNEELLHARAETEALLRQYADLYDFAPVGYFTLAPDGTILKVNLAGARVLGLEAGRLVARRFGTFVPVQSRATFAAFLEKVFTGGDRETCEIVLLRGESHELWVHIEAVLSDALSGEREVCRAVVSDITARRQAEEELRHLSTHDALTGLYSRSFFVEEMTRLERGRGFPVSIVMADVDYFKETNDREGHAVGDALLRRVARVLTTAFRAEDVIARIGGDEFAVLLPATGAIAAHASLRRVRQVIQANDAAHPEAPIRLSLGVSTAEHPAPLSVVLREADADMYRDKRRHGADPATATAAPPDAAELRRGSEANGSEREPAGVTLHHRVAELEALHAVSAVLRTAHTRDDALPVLLDEMLTAVEAEVGAIWLYHPDSDELRIAASRSWSHELDAAAMRPGEGIAGTVFASGQVSGDWGRACVPIRAGSETVGVLSVSLPVPRQITSEQINLLESLAELAGAAIDIARLLENLKRANAELTIAYDSTIEGWSRALDLRDRQTEGHTLRVTEITMRLARAAGIDEAEFTHIRRGALLHDIGKMGIPDVILLKPGKLTEAEWVIMRKHPQWAFDMSAPITYLRPALDIPYCHHERWDGTGYPRGLKGDQIPVAARLFAVVDVWDALRSDRPYRDAWPEPKVLEHIRAGSGAHFDPRAVELFMHMVNEGVPGTA